MDTIEDFKRFVRKRSWRYAATMPQWPHEYTVRRFDDPQDEQGLFEAAVNLIRAQEEPRVFVPTGKTSIYLDVEGRQYWTMGAPVEETIVINRAWLDWRERLARGETDL